MGISPGWVWILLPACQALVVPREVSGRAGETLSIRCWYPRGYEGYNKYWCRGDSRDSCHKVVETKGREVPFPRHGRVSIQDNHVFCVVLLTMKAVSKADAGNYWCGIERMGRDLMELVTVRVVPAALDTPAAPQATPTPWISNTTTDSPTNATITGPGEPALSILVPSVVLLSLLVTAASVGLLCTLRRRRGSNGAHACPIPGTPLRLCQDPRDKSTPGAGLQGASTSQRHRKAPPVSLLSGTLPPCTKAHAAPYTSGTAAELNHCPIYDNELDLGQGGCSDTEQDPELEDYSIHTNALCQEKMMGMPGQHLPGEEAPYLS